MVKKTVFLVLICIILLSILTYAEDNTTAISEEAIKAKNSLIIVEQGLDELFNLGFNTIRYNDTLNLVKQTYDAQLALEKETGKSDYSLINQKIDELNELKQAAFISSDELTTLEAEIVERSFSKNEEVSNLLDQAKEAFNSERYEEIIRDDGLADEIHKKMSELEAFDSKLKAFTEATSRSIFNFLKKNKWWVSSIIIILTVTTILTYDSIMLIWLKSQIKNLEIRKKSIQRLIAKTQRDYFEKGQISESAYKTRTKKYAELIRDINRQIPLLKEELEMRLNRLKSKRWFLNEKNRKKR